MVGAFWATAAAALDIGTYLLPMKQALETRILAAPLRMLNFPGHRLVRTFINDLLCFLARRF